MANNRKSRKAKAFKTVILTLLILVFTCVSGFIAYSYLMSRKMNEGSITAKKVDVNEPVNILLLGVDAGNPKDKTINNKKRSDTMMVLRYNPENNKAYILSLPRDTKVKINGHTEKLNAAHAIGGVEKTIDVIEDMLGISINYYVKVDYDGFKKCVDAVGGVDVTVPRDMDYDAGDISIHFKKGETVHLDGEKAERFVRWRKNNDGTGYALGDIGRQGTQQEFVLKVFEKVRTPEGVIRIPSLLSTISKYSNTNMDYATMIRYSSKIIKLNKANIDKSILPGEPKYINGVSYYIWDKEKSREVISNFKYKSYASDKNNEENVNRRKVDVVVLNSTGKNGLAAEYKQKLESIGYSVIKTGNYNKKFNKTVIRDYSGEGYGQTIRDDIDLGTVKTKDSKNEYNASVVIILGKDSINLN